MNIANSLLDIDSKSLHMHALDALAAADMALAHAPHLNIAEPHDLSAVTPAWLQGLFAAAAPGAQLLELSQVDAHSGMTDRMKWSLRWSAEGIAAGLPPSIFVKATPTAGTLREMLALLHMHEQEALFYAQIQPENPALAPRAHYARSYPGGRFLIVLEDLVSKGCRPYWQADDCSVDHIRAVAVALARLHARYWQSERFATDLCWVRPYTRRFGVSWLRQSHAKTRSRFLETNDAAILPEHARALLQAWIPNAERLLDYWGQLPRTLLHGDSHLGNTFSYPDGSAGLFDWQVIFSGHGLRDLAYFMLSAINNENRRRHEREIVELYLDVLADGGVKLDREQAWNDYCLFIIDRWDAAILSYMHASYGHATSGQIRGLTAIAGAIEDHDIGGRLHSLLRKV
jgi:hypothetical protein